jgi:hypothetical protein
VHDLTNEWDVKEIQVLGEKKCVHPALDDIVSLISNFEKITGFIVTGNEPIVKNYENFSVQVGTFSNSTKSTNRFAHMVMYFVDKLKKYDSKFKQDYEKYLDFYRGMDEGERNDQTIDEVYLRHKHFSTRTEVEDQRIKLESHIHNRRMSDERWMCYFILMNLFKNTSVRRGKLVKKSSFDLGQSTPAFLAYMKVVCEWNEMYYNSSAYGRSTRWIHRPMTQKVGSEVWKVPAMFWKQTSSQTELPVFLNIRKMVAMFKHNIRRYACIWTDNEVLNYYEEQYIIKCRLYPPNENVGPFRRFSWLLDRAWTCLPKNTVRVAAMTEVYSAEENRSRLDNVPFGARGNLTDITFPHTAEYTDKLHEYAEDWGCDIMGIEEEGIGNILVCANNSIPGAMWNFMLFGHDEACDRLNMLRIRRQGIDSDSSYETTAVSTVWQGDTRRNISVVIYDRKRHHHVAVPLWIEGFKYPYFNVSSIKVAAHRQYGTGNEHTPFTFMNNAGIRVSSNTGEVASLDDVIAGTYDVEWDVERTDNGIVSSGNLVVDATGYVSIINSEKYQNLQTTAGYFPVQLTTPFMEFNNTRLKGIFQEMAKSNLLYDIDEIMELCCKEATNKGAGMAVRERIEIKPKKLTALLARRMFNKPMAKLTRKESSEVFRRANSLVTLNGMKLELRTKNGVLMFMPKEMFSLMMSDETIDHVNNMIDEINNKMELKTESGEDVPRVDRIPYPETTSERVMLTLGLNPYVFPTNMGLRATTGDEKPYRMIIVDPITRWIANLSFAKFLDKWLKSQDAYVAPLASIMETMRMMIELTSSENLLAMFIDASKWDSTIKDQLYRCVKETTAPLNAKRFSDDLTFADIVNLLCDCYMDMRIQKRDTDGVLFILVLACIASGSRNTTNWNSVVNLLNHLFFMGDIDIMTALSGAIDTIALEVSEEEGISFNEAKLIIRKAVNFYRPRTINVTGDDSCEGYEMDINRETARMRDIFVRVVITHVNSVGMRYKAADLVSYTNGNYLQVRIGNMGLLNRNTLTYDSENEPRGTQMQTLQGIIQTSLTMNERGADVRAINALIVMCAAHLPYERVNFDRWSRRLGKLSKSEDTISTAQTEIVQMIGVDIFSDLNCEACTMNIGNVYTIKSNIFISRVPCLLIPSNMGGVGFIPSLMLPNFNALCSYMISNTDDRDFDRLLSASLFNDQEVDRTLVDDAAMLIANGMSRMTASRPSWFKHVAVRPSSRDNPYWSLIDESLKQSALHSRRRTGITVPDKIFYPLMIENLISSALLAGGNWSLFKTNDARKMVTTLGGIHRGEHKDNLGVLRFQHISFELLHKTDPAIENRAYAGAFLTHRSMLELLGPGGQELTLTQVERIITHDKMPRAGQTDAIRIHLEESISLYSQEEWNEKAIQCGVRKGDLGRLYSLMGRSVLAVEKKDGNYSTGTKVGLLCDSTPSNVLGCSRLVYDHEEVNREGFAGICLALMLLYQRNVVHVIN